MITVEKSIHINKPVEEVFAYTSNFENITRWQGGVESVEIDGDVHRSGGKYTEVRKFLGRDMKTTLVITEFEPNARWAAKALSGPVPYEVTATFKPVEGGTHMTTHIEGEPSGFFKLAQGPVQSQLEKSLDEDMQRLKDQVESS